MLVNELENCSVLDKAQSFGAVFCNCTFLELASEIQGRQQRDCAGTGGRVLAGASAPAMSGELSEEPGVWRKRSRPFIQSAPHMASSTLGFVAESSGLPAFALMEHGIDEDEDIAIGSTAQALGLDVSLPGMGDEDGPDRLGGLGAVLFDPNGECFAGVCLLARGEVVRLCGRVLQSFDCTADCCKRALIRLRMEVESDATRMPMQTVLAKSELNLGDFWNWRSAICSFSTETVVSDENVRAQIVEAHFRSLVEHENAVGTSGIVCVGPMHLLVDLPAPSERSLGNSERALSDAPWPPEGEAAVPALLARTTRCVWRNDMQWLGQGRHLTAGRNGSVHGGSADNSARGSARSELLSPLSPMESGGRSDHPAPWKVQ